MTTPEIICEAIAQRKLLEITYKGAERVVEPHMMAQNHADHYALSAWFVRGYSQSGEAGWREYLMDEISDITILDETFTGTRPGYQSSGGTVFHRVVCAL